MTRWISAAVLAIVATACAQESSVPAVEAARPGLVSILVDKVELKVDSTQLEPLLVGAKSSGSGFIFDTLGNILTCNHVISGYREISVKLSDGAVFQGGDVQVVGRDPVTDLAVLRIKPRRRFVPVELGNSDELEVGQAVIALGNPYGLEGTATAGIVSGLSRWGLAKSSGPDFQDFIQTDALVNPGNSGGPLVDARGRAVGVNSFTRSSRIGFTGIGFATPVNLAREVARQLLQNGIVVRGYLGVTTQPITDRLRQALDLSNTDGALVSAVAPDMPGMKAGIVPGDVIISLDGRPVIEVRTFQHDIAGRRPGSLVELGLRRGGDRRTVTVRLDEWPVAGTEASQLPPPRQWLGLAVRAAAVGNVQRPGVVIDTVENGSPAQDAGLLRGDVITEVNYAPIRNLAAFAKARSLAAATAKPALLRVIRGRAAFYVAVGP